MKIKELTKAEEQIMQILWKLEKGFVKEVMEELPVPKPAYNTVSTIIRILEQKEFVGHVSFGKSRQYYPLISKEEYTNFFMSGVVKNYFNNSFKSMLSYFAKKEDISVGDFEEILKEVNENK